MFKILEDKKTNKIIAVDIKTGAVYEEMGGVEAVENKTKIKRKYKKRDKKIIIENYSNRWSRKYDKCRGCGTTETIHAADGFCKNCYQNARSNKGEAKIWNYKCENDQCGEVFTSNLSLMDVVCPKCKSIHILKLKPAFKK